MNLTDLGWNGFYSRAFEPYASHRKPGRVIVADGAFYRVLTEDGEVMAGSAGRLHQSGAVVVGDWVVLGLANAIIENVLPRRTLLERQQAGTAFGRQAMAANIDVLFIVTGLDGDFSIRRIERYLVVAKHCGIEPVIVLSKCDLLNESARAQALETVRGSAPDVRVLMWSAFGPDGTSILDHAVPLYCTAALIGSSGAGKSTIVNRLLGAETFATQPVRESDGAGRHTTTRRQLIPLPQGWNLIDMPGLREVRLWADAGEVTAVFTDIDALAAECRYSDCGHQQEPGCAVQAAIAAGVLAPERLEQLRKLRAEASHVESAGSLTATLARKRRDKTIHRAMNRMKRTKPQLE